MKQVLKSIINYFLFSPCQTKENKLWMLLERDKEVQNHVNNLFTQYSLATKAGSGDGAGLNFYTGEVSSLKV